MIEFALNIDHSILNFIQEYLAPKGLYPMMDFFSQKESILYAAIPVFLWVFYQNWKKTVLFLAVLGITILGTDQTAYFFKKNITRVRPSQAHLPEGFQTQFNSFPSAHASNIVGAYFIIRFFWPFLRMPMLFIVFFVVYGRLFLNKHYPSDVLMGILIGLFYAQIVLRFILPFFTKRFSKIKDCLNSSNQEAETNNKN